MGLTPAERAKKITDSWFPPNSLTAKPVDLSVARDQIAAQISEANHEFCSKSIAEAYQKGFLAAKEKAKGIVMEYAAEWGECFGPPFKGTVIADRIGAMSPDVSEANISEMKVEER